MIIKHKMKFMLIVCVIVALSFNVCESKGGGRGLSRALSRGSSSSGWFGGGSKKSSSSSGGWFGGGSSSKPSSSGSGWFGSSSKPSSSTSGGWFGGGSKPSSSVSKPSSSNTNYGWNVGNTQTAPKSSATNTNYGWNVGNTQTAPKPSAPVGPPPSYPGLQNRPVNSYNNPPAYSPSYNSPPAYSSGIAPSYSNNYNRQPSYQTNYRSQNNHNSYSNPSYGNGYSGGYGSGGFGGSNTYVNNYYGGSRRSSSGSSFLTYGLLYGAGMHHGHSMGRSSSRRWDDEEDRRWRGTTKAPYFENKQPGSESILPAAAVLGAATAFGVYSLLPLNVPNGKPILSCNATELQQIQINFDGSTYGCSNNTITVACFKVDPITNGTMDLCPGQTLECDKTLEISKVSCTNGTLLSSEPIFCNSTTIMNGTNVNETSKILNCYAGVLPTNIAASIPTRAPVTTTEKPKSLSVGAKVHKFLLWTMGKSEITKQPLPTTTVKPEESSSDFVPRFLSENDTIAFVPTAVNDTTTNTTTIDSSETQKNVSEAQSIINLLESIKEE